MVWVLLRRDVSDQLLHAMVADRRLPVLQDTEAAAVAQLYGANSARSCLFFGRDGCLLPAKGEIPPQAMDTPRQLLPYIERAAR